MGMLVLVLCSLVGCETDTEAPAPAEPLQATRIAAPLKITEEMKANTRYDVLAPSPEETRQAVAKAGLTTALESLVPERAFQFTGISKDRAALRAGVCLSDTILTLHESEKATLVTQLAAFHEGLKVMGSGSGLLDTIKGLQAGIENDAMTRKVLLEELEAIVSMSVPEHGFAPNDRTGPLLQAGAWTAGVNLTAQAILKEDRIELAANLLRLGAVADYFLDYVNEEGDEKAGEAVLSSLRETLVELKALSDKEQMVRADVEQVAHLTGQVLDLI